MVAVTILIGIFSVIILLESFLCLFPNIYYSKFNNFMDSSNLAYSIELSWCPTGVPLGECEATLGVGILLTLICPGFCQESLDVKKSFLFFYNSWTSTDLIMALLYLSLPLQNFAPVLKLDIIDCPIPCPTLPNCGTAFASIFLVSKSFLFLLLSYI